ncbi:MAG: UDP-N-acetylmuramoyl-L-alanyl-D-glutamate--2,6-diaminopimelate ligase [Ruminococcaceae bacterium]|nr:UDP-N-acetylmuramoyl-L-alanyl-D-glutamate--2,6-diaminopimelate ligase [Oscillospiraceae bacterium]
MKLKDLLSSLAYTVVRGTTDTEISDIIYDSRKVIKGTAFVCLKGYNVDGHKYAKDAIDKGASAIIVSDDIETDADVTIIKVDNTRAALAQMSCLFFGNPAEELVTIGITGTKGKTTTVAMIRSILECAGIKTGTIGTLGIVIGDKIYKTANTTPESYEIQQAMRKMITKGCKAMVIEASSLGLKHHRTDCINFNYGIFTNFSNDHIGDSEHKDMEEYLSSKAMLFSRCKKGIINIDDAAHTELLKNSTCEKITYGFENSADYVAFGDKLLARQGFIGVHFETKGKKEISADVAIPGRFSVYNALAAVALCDDMGVDDKFILEGLKTVKVKGRVEAYPVNSNYTLLIDYAHNAVSMENVLTTLREYKPHRLITMFGAGGNRPRDRRFEMGEVSGRLSDLSVITEDNSRFEDVNDIIADIKVGIDKTDGKYVIVPNRVDAIRYCIENAEAGDIIVLAGKGHEDYQEIKGVKYHLDEREVIASILNPHKNSEDFKIEEE